MGSWVARKLEEHQQRKRETELLSRKAGEIWNQLRATIRGHVDEFNNLVRNDTAAGADFQESANSVVVRSKADPDTGVELTLDPQALAIVYRNFGNHKSALAADMSIFGDLDTQRQAFRLEVNDDGLCLMAKAQPLDLSEASEMVLKPILFPDS